MDVVVLSVVTTVGALLVTIARLIMAEIRDRQGAWLSYQSAHKATQQRQHRRHSTAQATRLHPQGHTHSPYRSPHGPTRGQQTGDGPGRGSTPSSGQRGGRTASAQRDSGHASSSASSPPRGGNTAYARRPGEESAPPPRRPAPAAFNRWAPFTVQPEMDLADLKRQYRTLARHHHPDCGGDAGAMTRINLLYDELHRHLAQSTMGSGGAAR